MATSLERFSLQINYILGVCSLEDNFIFYFISEDRGREPTRSTLEAALVRAFDPTTDQIRGLNDAPYNDYSEILTCKSIEMALLRLVDFTQASLPHLFIFSGAGLVAVKLTHLGPSQSSCRLTGTHRIDVSIFPHC